MDDVEMIDDFSEDEVKFFDEEEEGRISIDRNYIFNLETEFLEHRMCSCCGDSDFDDDTKTCILRFGICVICYRHLYYFKDRQTSSTTAFKEYEIRNLSYTYFN